VRAPCQPGAGGIKRRLTSRALRVREQITTRMTYNEVPGVCHEELAGAIGGRQRVGSSAITVRARDAARVGQLIEITGKRVRRFEARELHICKLRFHLEKSGGWEVGAEEFSDQG